MVLLAPSTVNGSLGDTVNLTCVLEPKDSEIPWVTQIRWERLEPWGDHTTVAEFDWERGPSIPKPEHVQFVSAGKDPVLLDASLTLIELEPDDDTNYTCEVTTYLQGSERASTWLQVFYAPLVSISLYEYTGQQGYRETNLSCEAQGNPEPEGYNWSTTTGPLPTSAVPQGIWLLLQPSEESINVTFICHVSNILGSTQAALNVLLPGPSQEQSPSLLALILVVLIMGLVTVVLKALNYFWCFRKFRQDQNSTLENETENDVSYAAVRTEAGTTW